MTTPTPDLTPDLLAVEARLAGVLARHARSLGLLPENQDCAQNLYAVAADRARVDVCLDDLRAKLDQLDRFAGSGILTVPIREALADYLDASEEDIRTAHHAQDRDRGNARQTVRYYDDALQTAVDAAYALLAYARDLEGLYDQASGSDADGRRRARIREARKRHGLLDSDRIQASIDRLGDVADNL